MGKKKSARRGNGAANNTTSKEQPAQSYSYPQAQALIRPDVGTQAQFKKRKEPRTYRYDSRNAKSPGPIATIRPSRRSLNGTARTPPAKRGKPSSPESSPPSRWKKLRLPRKN